MFSATPKQMLHKTVGAHIKYTRLRALGIHKTNFVQYKKQLLANKTNTLAAPLSRKSTLYKAIEKNNNLL